MIRIRIISNLSRSMPRCIIGHIGCDRFVKINRLGALWIQIPSAESIFWRSSHIHFIFIYLISWFYNVRYTWIIKSFYRIPYCIIEILIKLNSISIKCNYISRNPFRIKSSIFCNLNTILIKILYFLCAFWIQIPSIKCHQTIFANRLYILRYTFRFIYHIFFYYTFWIRWRKLSLKISTVGIKYNWMNCLIFTPSCIHSCTFL